VSEPSFLTMARVLGLPTDPFAHTSRFLRKPGGVYHKPNHWSNETRCHRPSDGFDEVDIPASKEIKICSRCGIDFHSAWGHQLTNYVTLLKHLTKVKNMVETAETRFAQGIGTTGNIKDLRRLAIQLEKPESMFDLEIKDLPEIGTTDFTADIEHLCREWKNRINTAVASSIEPVANSVVSMLTARGRVQMAMETTELVARSSWPKSYGYALSNIRDSWAAIRLRENTPVTFELAVQYWESRTGAPLGEFSSHTYISEIVETPRFSGAMFPTPRAWAQAEHKALMEEIVTNVVTRLESTHADLEANSHNAVLFVASMGNLTFAGEDIYAVVDPVASSTTTGVAAFRLPHEAAWIIAKGSGRTIFATEHDLDDETLRVAVGLYDTSPGSELSDWSTVIATATSITAMPVS
jgi:hypothetical protein